MLVDRYSDPVASVVIPAWKSRDTIPDCLRSLERQETDKPFDVTVVDSSGDGTGDMIREHFPRVRDIESDRRMLSGEARNLGASDALGRVLLFIDSDCVAEPAWIAKMTLAH